MLVQQNQQQDITPFRYIVIKDPHLMFGFKNRIRKSGWEKDIDSKLNQIINYCRENNINTIMFTGDVSEKSRKRDWSLNQILQNKKRLRLFKQAGIKIISNMGNHDYFDGHESIQDTAFGDYVESGLITYLGSNKEFIYIDITDGVQVQLSGVDYHEEKSIVEQELQEIADSYKPLQTLIKVCSIHSNVTSDPERLTDFTYNQLADYGINCLNCGHYHLQGSTGAVAQLKDTLFFNPWNLTRVSRDYHVKLDEHIPEFVDVIINWDLVENKPDITYNVVPLKVRPFSEAFNIEAVNLLQELGKSKFDFFKSIELKEDDGEADDDSIISAIAKEHKISKEAIEIAKGLLT